MQFHIHTYCREPPPMGLRGYGGWRTEEWRAPGPGGLNTPKVAGASNLCDPIAQDFTALSLPGNKSS